MGGDLGLEAEGFNQLIRQVVRVAGGEAHPLDARHLGRAQEQVREGDADIAFLMNPVSIRQVRDIAFASEVLPQKSTDFYPKLLSGLAIYALE